MLDSISWLKNAITVIQSYKACQVHQGEDLLMQTDLESMLSLAGLGQFSRGDISSRWQLRALVSLLGSDKILCCPQKLDG